MTSVFYSRNLFKTKSKYSETRIYDFICKFLGKLPSARLVNIENTDNADCVCIECLGKIDEYDLATLTAQRVEKELRDFLLNAESLMSPEAKVFSIGIGSGGDGTASNDDDNHLARPIETIEMIDQFKVENIESNDSSDLAEPTLNDDYDESSTSNSDDEYRPPGNLKKQLNRKVIKMKRTASTRGRKLHQSNPQVDSVLEQQTNLKCAECNATFKRYNFLKERLPERYF